MKKITLFKIIATVGLTASVIHILSSPNTSNLANFVVVAMYVLMMFGYWILLPGLQKTTEELKKKNEKSKKENDEWEKSQGFNKF